jgi:hypothetical protein
MEKVESENVSRILYYSVVVQSAIGPVTNGLLNMQSVVVLSPWLCHSFSNWPLRAERLA